LGGNVPYYRVLLPVANPEHVEQLASLAAVLAKANEGGVLALHVRGGLVSAKQIPPVLQRVEQIVSQTGVPVQAMPSQPHLPASSIHGS